ncbi:metacaspase-1-like [Gossypium australe]|uniref:Metacaspase-1-like n=1 Tax=Gossypium australe TaxID=47621 RepID=A0A5B6X6N3_9ROSI|nr:metacaspase-1-like [Gossypium australe]
MEILVVITKANYNLGLNGHENINILFGPGSVNKIINLLYILHRFVNGQVGFVSDLDLKPLLSASEQFNIYETQFKL